MSPLSPPSFDVTVIGAGFAGLSAAVELAARGRHVLVLEARPHLGGRATSYRDRTTGERVDNGQHVLFGCYRETFRFLDRVGVAGEVSLQTSLAVESVDRDGSMTRFECPYLPPPLHLFAGILEWDALPFGERVGMLRLAGPLRQARRAIAGVGREEDGLSTETVRDWLIRHRQGPRIRELLWEPLALAALNQQPDHAAARPFVRVLAELCGSRVRDAAIGVPRRPLDELYAEPARRFIEARGGVVRVRAAAHLRTQDDDSVAPYVEGAPVETHAVVAAVPWHALPSLFASPPEALSELMRAARATESSPIVTVNLWLDRPVLTTPFVGLPGRTMQWAFDKRAVLGAGASHVSLVSSGATDAGQSDNQQIIDRAVSELRDACGSDWQVTHASVIREPHATFSLAPGQPPRPDTETSVPGFFLAGDWIETGLPGTIESAVVSGHRAADAACRWLSRTR